MPCDRSNVRTILVLSNLLDALCGDSGFFMVTNGEWLFQSQNCGPKKERPYQGSTRHFRDCGGKKAALQTGIEAAKYDICAFTDADCFPPPSWLARHASYYDSDSKVGVVGFAPLRTKKGLLGLV
jgi:cellulose synthase/poly-beta-1,6-N-acetylglucosamine synthase-like glycosyltransferase